MSGDRPFAQSHGDAVVMDGVQLLAPGHEDALVAAYADSINAAVAARERKAAAKALREAADAAMDEGCGGEYCNRPGYVHAEWLRRRADQIEKVEA